jgi:hypothetical protein
MRGVQDKERNMAKGGVCVLLFSKECERMKEEREKEKKKSCQIKSGRQNSIHN